MASTVATDADDCDDDDEGDAVIHFVECHGIDVDDDYDDTDDDDETDDDNDGDDDDIHLVECHGIDVEGGKHSLLVRHAGVVYVRYLGIWKYIVYMFNLFDIW